VKTEFEGWKMGHAANLSGDVTITGPNGERMTFPGDLLVKYLQREFEGCDCGGEECPLCTRPLRSIP
jgi:hypothetical protein